MTWTTAIPAVTTAFLSSFVEAVEALTIVLAVAVVRGWRPAGIGALAGLVLLALIVLALGPLLDRIPLHLLQVVVGVLLLLFGMRWLRKAILRAAGIIPLHDEAVAFATETEGLRDQAHRKEARLDWLAGLASFKAVVLEGLEVVFIVIVWVLHEVSLGRRASAHLRHAWSWLRQALSYIVRSHGSLKTRSSLPLASCFQPSEYFGREKDSVFPGLAVTLLS